jgi:hypothetical protein
LSEDLYKNNFKFEEHTDENQISNNLIYSCYYCNDFQTDNEADYKHHVLNLHGRYIFVHSLQNLLSFDTSYVYLTKIPNNELTNDAATKDDAAITTNFNVLFIDHYCVITIVR